MGNSIYATQQFCWAFPPQFERSLESREVQGQTDRDATTDKCRDTHCTRHTTLLESKVKILLENSWSPKSKYHKTFTFPTTCVGVITWNYILKVTTKNGIADQIPTVRHANRFRWWRCSNVPPDWWLILWWTKRMAWKPRPLSDNRWLFFRLWHPWCCSWSSSWRREIFMTLWHSWEDASLVYFSLPRASVVAFSRGWHLHAFADCDFDCIYIYIYIVQRQAKKDNKRTQ